MRPPPPVELRIAAGLSAVAAGLLAACATPSAPLIWLLAENVSAGTLVLWTALTAVATVPAVWMSVRCVSRCVAYARGDAASRWGWTLAVTWLAGTVWMTVFAPGIGLFVSLLYTPFALVPGAAVLLVARGERGLRRHLSGGPRSGPGGRLASP